MKMIKAKQIKIHIETGAETDKRITKELKDIEQGKAITFKEDSISFKSFDQMRKILTPKRLELLRNIKNKKPRSIYGLAKIVGRTPENVNTDLRFLEMIGFVHMTKVEDVRTRVVPEVYFDKISIEINI